MSATTFAFILVVFILGNSKAVPVRDYDGVPSGILQPVSGVVPVSVPRRRPNVADNILRAIRHRVDKNQVQDLSSTLRRDISQEALAPPECNDKYGIRDGVAKHIIRGIRDVGGAVVQDLQGLVQGDLKYLPLVPNVINGVAEAITYIFCGVEDVFSDIASGGFDDGADILTKLVVDLIELKGSAPFTNAATGVVNLTQAIGKVGIHIIEDLVSGINKGVVDLAGEVVSGVEDVVHDVENVVHGVVDVVSGVETDVANVVTAVKSAAQMIGGGVGKGVGNILEGVQGGLGGVVNAL